MQKNLLLFVATFKSSSLFSVIRSHSGTQLRTQTPFSKRSEKLDRQCPHQHSNTTNEKGTREAKMVYTIVVHLLAKEDQESISKLSAKLVEASQVYSKDKETLSWFVMQDTVDKRKFTIVERYLKESVSLIFFLVRFMIMDGGGFYWFAYEQMLEEDVLAHASNSEDDARSLTIREKTVYRSRDKLTLAAVPAIPP